MSKDNCVHPSKAAPSSKILSKVSGWIRQSRLQRLNSVGLAQPAEGIGAPAVNVPAATTGARKPFSFPLPCVTVWLLVLVVFVL